MKICHILFGHIKNITYICTRMNKKLPYILSFEDLYDLYKNAEIYDSRQSFSFLEPVSDVYKLNPSYKRSVLGMGEEKKNMVLETLSKYKNEIDEIENTMLDFIQFQIMVDPQVYLARTKDIKTDIEYLTAKTFFPLKGGKKKEVKVYVGKSKNYNSDTTDKRAISMAKIKMMNTLKRRLNEGSL